MGVEERLKQDLATNQAAMRQIQADVASLRLEEQHLASQIAYIQSVLREGVLPPDPNQQRLIETDNQPPRRKMTLIEVAVEILTKAGGRLKMEEIVNRAIEMKLRDAPTPEERLKLRANLSSVLSHHSRSENPRIMKSTKKRGYYKLAPAAAIAV